MKDLEFIRSVVKEWPENEHTVRLDSNGEICFMGSGSCATDFFPDDIDAAIKAFIPDQGRKGVGKQYTREQWAGETL